MKTVAEVIDEERQRQTPEFVCLLINISGTKYAYDDVSNFKHIGVGYYEFDHIRGGTKLMHSKVRGDILYTDKFCGLVKPNDK